MMHTRGLSIRVRRLVVGLAAAGAALSALAGGTAAAVAQGNAAIMGAITAIPVSGGYQIQQLFAGTDGQLWFVTSQSKLGRISATGQASLTGVVLPHGEFTAQIAAAGPEGVWTFSNTNAFPPTANACVVGLVTPDGVLHNVALPPATVETHSTCGGAAADSLGDLWLSLDAPECSKPCRVGIVAEITPSGTSTLFMPARSGAKPWAMALGSDGSIWVFEGYRDQNLVRYTGAGIGSVSTVPSKPSTILYARPDGTFWAGGGRFCSGVTFCDDFAVFNPTTGTVEVNRVFPVGRTASPLVNGPYQFGVDAQGSLWAAGHNPTGPDRLFRMNASGTIDRSTAFPQAIDGSVLHANGTIAVSSAGEVWAIALSATGADYVVRFQLLP